MANNQGESIQERNTQRTGRCLLAALTFGALIVLAYSVPGGGKAANSTSLGFFKVLGTGLAMMGAFLVLGILLGFIFSLPRSVQESATATGNGSPADKGTERNRLKVNTNLEQISDWLTKILVGVGLAHLTAIPGKLQALGDYIALGLGGEHSDKIFALTIVLYSFICGFFIGYLLTRLYLAGAFLVADNTAEEVMRAVDMARGAADTARGAVESFEMNVLSVARAPTVAPLSPATTAGAPLVESIAAPQQWLPTWQTLAQDYNRIRNTQKPGDERTSAMSQVFNQMCILAAHIENYDPREQLQASEEGRRLFAYAYLATRPNVALLTALVDSVTQYEGTSYGQYRGIQAIGRVLSAADTGAARAVLGQLETFANRFERHSGRYYELNRILNLHGEGAKAS